MIIESYVPVYQSVERLPVLGTMGLSSEDIKALRQFLDENTKPRQD